MIWAQFSCPYFSSTHSSTGFEALLGTLYLQEDNDRLYEIAEAAFQVISRAMMEEVAAGQKQP